MFEWNRELAFIVPAIQRRKGCGLIRLRLHCHLETLPSNKTTLCSLIVPAISASNSVQALLGFCHLSFIKLWRGRVKCEWEIMYRKLLPGFSRHGWPQLPLPNFVLLNPPPSSDDFWNRTPYRTLNSKNLNSAHGLPSWIPDALIKGEKSPLLPPAHRDAQVGAEKACPQQTT